MPAFLLLRVEPLSGEFWQLKFFNKHSCNQSFLAVRPAAGGEGLLRNFGFSASPDRPQIRQALLQSQHGSEQVTLLFDPVKRCDTIED